MDEMRGVKVYIYYMVIGVYYCDTTPLSRHWSLQDINLALT